MLAVVLVLSGCYAAHDAGRGRADAGDARVDERDARAEFDAADDVGFDAARDVGFDAAGDVGFDAARDAGVDGPDARLEESGRDGGRDAGREAGVDAGRPRIALRFAPGRYIFVADDGQLDLVDAATLELWVRARGDGVLSIKGPLDDRRFHLYVALQGESIVAGWSSEDAESLVRAPFPRGTWTHVAVVQENLSTGEGSVTLYLDGARVADALGPSVRLGAINDRPWIVGEVDADVDELRLWSLARDAASIRGGMRQRVPPMTPSLVVYLPLEERGQIALDRTLQGHDAVLGSLTTEDEADPDWIEDGAF